MECACYDTSEDCDGPVEILKDIYRKARKEHTCKECFNTIKKGDKYRLETFVFEGEIEDHKTCPDCDSVREYLVCQFAFGALWEGLFDSIDYYGDDSIQWGNIGKLTKKARDKVLKFIEERWYGCDDEEDD